MSISIRQLRLFQAVAHAGHVTHAARQMNLTQPAVTHQMRQLEAALGHPLFVRHGRRLVLTGEGETLLRETDAVIAGFDAMLGRVRRGRAGEARGLVRIAALQSYNQSLVVRAAVVLAGSDPGIRICAREMAADRISAAVASGEADIGLTFRIAPDRSVRAQALARERLVALANDTVMADLGGPLTFSELARYPLALMPPEFSLRALVENCAADHHVPLNVVFESSNHMALMDYARATGAIAIVPQWMARVSSAMHCLELAHPIEREVSLIVRRGAVPEAQTRVIEAISEALNEDQP